MENKYNDYIKEILPGYLQGVSRVCMSYPFDYIRTKIQSNQESNISKAIKKNHKQLFRGLFIPLIAVPIDRGISFAVYEKIKKNYDSPFIASVVPSIISNIYMVPVNSTNSNYIYFNKLDFKTIIKQNLNKNIFNGYGIEILRNTTSSFLFLYSYNFYSKYSDNSILNGTLASLTMWNIVYPLDTIKTNMFIFKNKSYMDIIKTTPFTRFYKGISLIYLRALPSAGGGMYIYELTKKNLNI